MIEKLESNRSDCLAFRVSGDVTKSDYEVLRPATEAAVSSHDVISLLLDLRDFHSEKASAWRADLKFGHDFRKNINKLAVVGDGTLEKLIADVAHPFYSRESQHFSGMDEAWTWLNE